MPTYPTGFSTFFLMNVHLCHDEDGDGCGGLFVNKSNPGLCAKSMKLVTLNNNPVELDKWRV
jgi:hypothetical protein